jgi:hypothetical protein
MFGQGLILTGEGLLGAPGFEFVGAVKSHIWRLLLS